MRTWLYNRVLAALASTQYADKLFQSGNVDERVAPFAVLVMMVEQPFLGMPVTDRKVGNVPFAVNLHVPSGESMLDVDDAAQALKSTIVTEDSVVVGGVTVMNLRWTDIGQDGYDDHWGTDFRPVRFNMVICR
jgi:hypothetical protein